MVRYEMGSYTKKRGGGRERKIRCFVIVNHGIKICFLLGFLLLVPIGSQIFLSVVLNV